MADTWFVCLFIYIQLAEVPGVARGINKNLI